MDKKIRQSIINDIKIAIDDYGAVHFYGVLTGNYHEGMNDYVVEFNRFPEEKIDNLSDDRLLKLYNSMYY
ncbi:MAG: hypothetical protein IAC58_02890 [Firmicutes bacterium]|uniref:Uncharacterized protein n=1 Tax=Candidatus Onthovivens merdipullorum TaxID=2840889 RepID=A0A9D9DJ97_9BACL|nr:hypothetical protein [Candidatus Onthovivens merdipullorum]